MKSFLYIINKNSDNLIESKKVIQMIDILKNCSHKHFEYTKRNIQCFAYTNEPNVDPRQAISNDQHFFTATAGQLGITDQKFQEDIMRFGSNTANKYIKNLSGGHAVSFAHFESNTVRVYNHFSRVNPVYLLENDKRIVIGLDPLIVNCVGYNTYKPIFDIDQSVSFITQGYFSDDATLFKSVFALAANSEVCVKNNSLTVSQIDNSIQQMFTKKPTSQDYDDLTELYLKSFEPIIDVNKTHRIGLTGGKDSRLILLGLLANNIPFKASTRGFDDHPDVIIAQKIASELGIEHEVIRPTVNNENQLVINLRERLENVMLGTGGTVYGYENIHYLTEYKGITGLSGIAAETIQGGYNNLKRKERKQVSSEMIKSFFALKDFILPEKRYLYENFLYNFTKEESSFLEAQCKHFLFYRTGRWTGGARSSNQYTSDIYSPFYDVNFIKKATQLDIKTLSTDVLHYNIMIRLNPIVAEMPFYQSRWMFEEKGPINPNDIDNWYQKNPIYAKTTIGAYNWRFLVHEDPTLRNELKRIITRKPESPIFEIVNFEQVCKILDNPVPSKLNKFIWSLASIQAYIDYFDDAKPDTNHIINLTLPETIILEKSRNPIIHNVLPIITPTNSAVTTTSKNTGLSIQVDTAQKVNYYLQTGDSSFATPPKNNHDLLSVKNSKNIYVRFCMESPNQSFNYSLFIMFYNKAERIFSESSHFNANINTVYLEKKLSIPQNAEFVKIAVKLKPKGNKLQLNMKYGYMKIT